MFNGLMFGLRYLFHRFKGSESVNSYYSRIGDDVMPSLNTNFAKVTKPLWLNLGYWEKAIRYRDACEALAARLAETAGLEKGDLVLDVGFGFGEQDLYWLRNYNVAKITGINITQLHIDIARKRIQQLKLDDRIDFQFGSATDMQFEDASFTKVLALESAFHFESREAFFKQAYRVLKPGGILATADMLPLKGEKFTSHWKYMGRRELFIPEENMYPADTYAEKLKLAGFTDIRIESIARPVYNGMRKYFIKRAMNKQLEPSDLEIMLTPADLKSKKGPAFWGFAYGTSDYVLVRAKKK